MYSEQGAVEVAGVFPLRSYLDTKGGLCLAYEVLPSFDSMRSYEQQSKWFGCAASAAMRGVRTVTDEKTYDEVGQSFAARVLLGAESEVVVESDDGFGGLPGTPATSEESGGDWPGGSSAWGVSEDVLDVFGVEDQPGVARVHGVGTVAGMAQVPQSALRMSVVRQVLVDVDTVGAVTWVGYGPPVAGQLTLESVLVAARLLLRGVGEVGTTGQVFLNRSFVVADTYKIDRLMAGVSYLERVGPGHEMWRRLCLQADVDVGVGTRPSGFCLDTVLGNGSQRSYGAWPSVGATLRLPCLVSGADLAKHWCVMEKGGGTAVMWWHVLPYRPDRGAPRTLMSVLREAASGTDPGDWPIGSVGELLADGGRGPWQSNDRVFGAPNALAAWIASQIGSEIELSAADLAVAGCTTALLSADQKVRHGMLESVGDAVLTLSLAHGAADDGSSKQGFQALRAVRSNNKRLCSVFVEAVPTGLVVHPQDVDMNSSKSGADAVEVLIGLVYLAGGLAASGKFIKSLGLDKHPG